jgi:hypothetical protein
MQPKHQWPVLLVWKETEMTDHNESDRRAAQQYVLQFGPKGYLWTQPDPDFESHVNLFLAGLAHRDELVRRLLSALETIAAHAGMTNLGECCVDKTCTPVYEDGEKISHCQFSFGVNRGFNTCAAEAKEALAGIKKDTL